jgi:translocation protein SEC62
MTDACCSAGQTRHRQRMAYATISSDKGEASPKELKNAADYLLNQKVSQLKSRTGVMNGKRVQYFRGKSALNALLRDAYSKAKGPSVSSREDAQHVLEQLLHHQFILRCDRTEARIAGTRQLQPNPLQEIQDEYYYVWLYEGSQLGVLLGGLALVAAVFAGVMFPLWPQVMRDGAWYVSVGILGLLGLLVVITIIRLIFFIITYVVVYPGIWIFPNLYEDVGFIDSFIPLWAWAEPAKKSSHRPAAEASTSPKTSPPTAHTPLLERVSDNEATTAGVVSGEDEEVEELIADKKD